MNLLDSLSGDTENFFKFLGLGVFLCFMIYVICQVISFNYSFVEGMIGEKHDHIAEIIKKGGDGGRVGLDQDKITKRLEEDRTLLNKLLKLPQDTGKLREQLNDFKENVVLRELLLLNEASCKDCSNLRLGEIGSALHSYKNIGQAIDRAKLEKTSSWI